MQKRFQFGDRVMTVVVYQPAYVGLFGANGDSPLHCEWG